MAVPKKKMSKPKTRTRRSHDALTPSNLSGCSHCGAARQSHRACPECGFYNGRQIIRVEEEEEA